MEALAASAQRLGVGPPQGREWFDLLHRKLLPQLQGPPLLIVAIVGGTNIGKSVVFNHLAGETASAATPLAAGTKHPVCLVPPGCDDPQLLGRLFEHFQLRAWQSAEDPLEDSPTDRLYWRLGAQVPQRLVLVDAPDVDSDVTVNWQRARAIRQTADVLIALLTQQKYNDAAVKQFFRAAVEADKPIIVIFNFCDLEADRDYWPQWLAASARNGSEPGLDLRGALRSRRGPRTAPAVLPVSREQGAGSREQGAGCLSSGDCWRREPFLLPAPAPCSLLSPPSSPTDLRNELAALHFDAIKIRTFRGAWHACSMRSRGCRATSARSAPLPGSLPRRPPPCRRPRWPASPGRLPTSVLVDEIEDWWDADRTDWSRRVHGFYRVIGAGLLRPVRAAGPRWPVPRKTRSRPFSGRSRPPLSWRSKNSSTSCEAVAGGQRDLAAALAADPGRSGPCGISGPRRGGPSSLPPVDEDYRGMLRGELDAWKASYPRIIRWFRTLDQALAVARPAITVTLCVSGGVLAGDLVGQAAMHAAGHVAGQVAADAAIATGITEAVVTTGGEGARQAAARLFRRLQARFAQKRAQWLADFLERELLGSLLEELRQGAAVPDSIEFRNAEAAMAELKL